MRVVLSKKEREVLDYLTKDFLTVKKIAVIKGCSVQSVYKIIRKIKEKGKLKDGLKGVEKRGVYFKPFKKGCVKRLHGQQLWARIVPTDRYVKLRRVTSAFSLEGNHVRLNEGSVEVYSNSFFVGGSVDEVYGLSLEYWEGFLNRLENRLGVVFRGFKEVKGGEYADVGNELARSCNESGDRISVRGSVDGMVWLSIDMSFRDELETVHPERARVDMRDVVDPFFNDLRDNKPPLPSEVWALLGEVARHERELSAGLLGVLEVLKPKRSVGKSDVFTRPDYVG